MSPKERNAKVARERMIRTRKSLELSISALSKVRDSYNPDHVFYKQFDVAIDLMCEARYDLRKHVDILHSIVEEGGAQ